MSQVTSVVVLLLLGLIAGVLSGMFGIGGGLVIVPALIVLGGFGTKEATGTSLFALMWPVGLLGVIEYARRGELRLVPGILIAVGLFIGAAIGARITGGLSETTMKRLYGFFLLVVGIYFLVTAQSSTSAPGLTSPAAPARVSPESAPAQVQRPPDLS
jgi:uncharacterized membrane protein YfcA